MVILSVIISSWTLIQPVKDQNVWKILWMVTTQQDQ
jgi:hypothetical protein